MREKEKEEVVSVIKGRDTWQMPNESMVHSTKGHWIREASGTPHPFSNEGLNNFVQRLSPFFLIIILKNIFYF